MVNDVTIPESLLPKQASCLIIEPKFLKPCINAKSYATLMHSYIGDDLTRILEKAPVKVKEQGQNIKAQKYYQNYLEEHLQLGKYAQDSQTDPQKFEKALQLTLNRAAQQDNNSCGTA